MPISQEILDRIVSNDVQVELNLSRQLPELTDEDIKSLAVALKGNTAIKRIILCENSIGDQGAIALANELKNSSVDTLDLAVNNLTNEGASALLKVPTLRELDISANQLTNELVPSILKNQTLISLMLDDNNITQDSMKQISEHLQNKAISEILRYFQQGLEMASQTLPPDKQAFIKGKFLSLSDQLLTKPTQAGTLFKMPMVK